MSLPDPHPSDKTASPPGAPHASAFATQQAAIALAYRPDDDAPRVVAKGRGLVAQAIIERARQHGVYVHQSRELVSLLMQVDIDRRIPPQLYRVVAELLAWIYRVEKRDAAPGNAYPLWGDSPAPRPQDLEAPER